MQKQFIKNIYQEFVYCDPNDHLLKPNNNLTKPECNCKSMCNSCKKHMCEGNKNSPQIITIQSDITGHYGQGPQILAYNNVTQNINTPELESVIKPNKTPDKPQHIIYDEDTFNQIKLRGFITKDLLKQSLDKGSNLFHIAEDIFDDLCDKYHQFKEILHTLTTEFDNTIQCVIETGKEITKKISHIIYELYLAVVNKNL